MIASSLSGSAMHRCVLFALVIASSLSEITANDNFTRPFTGMSDEKIGTFLKLNPSLTAHLSDMHFMRYTNEHERVIKGLVLPLLFDQRVTLLVSRFHNVISGGVTDQFLDKFIDTIDDTSLPVFLLQLVVAPSYPLYQTFQQIDSQSSLDETLQFVFLLLSLIELLRFSAFILNLHVSRKTSGASFWTCVTDAEQWRAPVASFLTVGAFALVSYYLLWNPSISGYIPLIFTTVVSVCLGAVLKKKTSNIFIGFLPPIICHSVAYFLFGTEALMPQTASRIPLQILSNCLAMALPILYIHHMRCSLDVFVNNIGWLYRMRKRDIVPAPVPLPHTPDVPAGSAASKPPPSQKVSASSASFIDDRLIPSDEISFENGRVLGQGGCGTVLLAKYFKAKVAVKFINPKGNAPPDPRNVQSMLEEVSMQQQLQHPSVVRIFGVVKQGAYGNQQCEVLGQTYYYPAVVMQLCANKDLSQLFSTGESISYKKRIEYAKKIAQGIAYLHAHNITHSDLKPANVLFSPSGDIQISDFGMSLRGLKGDMKGGTQFYAAPEYATERMFDKNYFVNLKDPEGNPTPVYITPEMEQSIQSRSFEISNKVDVYAFAMIMWFLITGKNPDDPEFWSSQDPLQHATYGLFGGRPSSSELIRIVSEHPEVASLPSNWIDQFLICMRLCWKQNPDERITMSFAVTLLEKIVPDD